MLDLIVRGGTLVAPDGVRRADLGVLEGVVAAVGDVNETATEEVDARGLHVFPGLIDVHVHFNEPGRADWEGLATGSAALAAGGGTLFCDMPLNSDPPLLTAQDFAAKRAAAEAQSLTDFALWGGLTPDNLEHLPELAEAGVVGFKAFMSDSGIPEFRAADDDTLLEGMRSAAALGLPVAVHAESEALTAALTRRLAAQGSVRAYLASRPPVAEEEAVQRACLFALETGCKLHLVHLSSGAAVARALQARAEGADVSVETCPHYLHFTEADLERVGAVLKCAPPLRDEMMRETLWAALLAGGVDIVASDHSPAPPELKERENFFGVWGGVAGVQASLSVLLSHPERGLSLERVAALTAAAPAQRFDLGGKGGLEPGCDADFSLVALEERFTLEKADLLSRHKLSPYLGERLQGRVRQTFSRGRCIFRDGRITAPPAGRLLRPAAGGRAGT
jgi:allantoinase